MTLRSFEFPIELSQLMQECKALTGGHAPIMHVADSDNYQTFSCLHVPTLYPEISVPNVANGVGDWGETARGLKHVVRSMTGVPVLCVHGDAMQQTIASDINEELEWLACAQAKLTPRPKAVANLVEQITKYLSNVKEETLRGHIVFRAVQLMRMQYEGNEQATDALQILKRPYVQFVALAEAAFKKILALDLSQPSGKAESAKLLLDAFGIESTHYFFRRHRFNRGITDSKSFGYFEALESVRADFETSVQGPFVWLQTELPFAIPARDGLYVLPNATLFLRRQAILNSRASWERGSEMIVEENMGASGLYENSIIEMRIGGIHSIGADTPPEPLLYKNIFRFPGAIREAVTALNTMLTWLRVTTQRCDLPEVIPGHLNKLKLKQFGKDGQVLRNIESLSLEYLTLTAGPKKTEDEVAAEPVIVGEITFWRELLESAKLHVLQGNARRANLDFCSAFEAFTDKFLTSGAPQKESKKSAFLRIYGTKLSPSTLEEITRLDANKCNDLEMPISIHKLVRNYCKSGQQPTIEEGLKSLIMKAYEYRNDAAHGRPIPESALVDVADAITSLDKLAALFSAN